MLIASLSLSAGAEFNSSLFGLGEKIEAPYPVWHEIQLYEA